MEVAIRSHDAPVRASADGRATLRRSVKLVARLRDRSSSRFAITIVDLSMSGFRAETVFNLRPGTVVWITLPGLSGLEAEIAWQHGDHIGGRFRQPLYPAVFEHICELGR